MSTQITDQGRVVLIKYLLEAHSKERQLETALQAQIVGAKSPVVEQALVEHLAVTRDQIRALETRLSALGHESSLLGLPSATAVAGAVLTVANKGLSLAKGPLQLLRGTSPADNELRNLRDAYWNEAEEIAHYRVIETVAKQVGDTETAELAARHRKEEETMQRTIEGLLPGTVRSLIDTEAPSAGKSTPRPSATAASRTRGAHPAKRAAAKARGAQAGKRTTKS